MVATVAPCETFTGAVSTLQVKNGLVVGTHNEFTRGHGDYFEQANLR